MNKGRIKAVLFLVVFLLVMAVAVNLLLDMDRERREVVHLPVDTPAATETPARTPAPAETPATLEKLRPYSIRASRTPKVYRPFHPPPSSTRQPGVSVLSAVFLGIWSIPLYIFSCFLNRIMFSAYSLLFTCQSFSIQNTIKQTRNPL